jgi:antitoxin PrlF
MNALTPINQEARIVSGGRLQISSEFRRALGLKEGDHVVLEIDGGQLIVRPYREVIRRIQERLAPYAPTDGTLLSDELIADRRAEAERE